MVCIENVYEADEELIIRCNFFSDHHDMDSATYLTPIANPKPKNYPKLISQEDSAMLEAEGLYVEPDDLNLGSS